MSAVDVCCSLTIANALLNVVLTSESLCCKSGLEYEQFYKALESGKVFRFSTNVMVDSTNIHNVYHLPRWFCHFDDDEYLNVVNLFKELKKYDSSADYYVGHWLTKHGKKPKRIGWFKFFPEAKRTRYFYATGASYCVSSGLMKKVKKYFRGQLFPVTCRKIGLTDDYTVGSVIGELTIVLGVCLFLFIHEALRSPLTRQFSSFFHVKV